MIREYVATEVTTLTSQTTHFAVIYTTYMYPITCAKLFILQYNIVSYFCSVQVGKEFDALIIDTAAPQGAPTFDTFEDDTIEVCME